MDVTICKTMLIQVVILKKVISQTIVSSCHHDFDSRKNPAYEKILDDLHKNRNTRIHRIDLTK